MRCRAVSLLLILLAVTSSQSGAQRADDLPRGARVRIVTADGGMANGFVNAVTADAILLQASPHKTETVSARYERNNLRSIAVLKKRTGRGALRGAALGLLIGGGGGFLLGAATYSDSDCGIIVCGASEAGALAGMLGAIVGIPAGALFGAAHGMPQWRTVELR